MLRVKLSQNYVNIDIMNISKDFFRKHIATLEVILIVLIIFVAFKEPWSFSITKFQVAGVIFMLWAIKIFLQFICKIEISVSFAPAIPVDRVELRLLAVLLAAVAFGLGVYWLI